MNMDEILRQLQNSGIRVLGSDSVNVYIEDPSCILRGFETFIEYAWVIITFITGMLLFGWAISMIRGVKNNLTVNIRNLLIMFGTLAAVVPIVNTVWGGDLFGRGCRTVGVSVASIREILDARNIKPVSDDSLFENFDIYDSGVVEIPDDEADSDNASYAPIVPPSNDASDNESPDAGAASDVSVPSTGGRVATSATGEGNDVIYTMSDRSRVRYTGGTRAWRNTNPGNLRYSDFSARVGAIGRAGGFAVFPTEDVGANAIVALLNAPSYRNLTIAQAISRYAPPFENDTAAYHRRISQLTGLDINRRISELSTAELMRVAGAIRQIEGWRTGRKIEL